VLRFLGYGIKGHNYRRVQAWTERWNISTDHFDPHVAVTRSAATRRVPLERVLVEHSPYTRGNLKRRLLAAGLKQPVCELCGQVVKVGAKYGVSDNAVRKWLRWYQNEAIRVPAAAPAGETGQDRAP
jgi:hypothetical protein